MRILNEALMMSKHRKQGEVVALLEAAHTLSRDAGVHIWLMQPGLQLPARLRAGPSRIIGVAVWVNR